MFGVNVLAVPTSEPPRACPCAPTFPCRLRGPWASNSSQCWPAGLAGQKPSKICWPIHKKVPRWRTYRRAEWQCKWQVECLAFHFLVSRRKMGRHGESDEDDLEEEAAVKESLLGHRYRERDHWEDYMARIRCIVNRRNKAPLDKVRDLKDFAAILTVRMQSLMAPDTSCCGRFQACIAKLWSYTGACI